MSTHNIGFYVYEDLTKLSFNYHQIHTLSLLLYLVILLNLHKNLCAHKRRLFEALLICIDSVCFY